MIFNRCCTYISIKSFCKCLVYNCTGNGIIATRRINYRLSICICCYWNTNSHLIITCSVGNNNLQFKLFSIIAISTYLSITKIEIRFICCFIFTFHYWTNESLNCCISLIKLCCQCHRVVGFVTSRYTDNCFFTTKSQETVHNTG